MKTIVAILSFVTLAQAATLLPLDQSIVKVKSERNGQDYSYSIQENRGIAVDPLIHTLPQIIPQPTIKVTHELHRTGSEILQKEEPQEIHQMQEHELKTSQAQAKAFHELTYNALPLTYPYGYAYHPTFYTHNIMPAAYQYAYTYPYAYRLNYNLIPIKHE